MRQPEAEELTTAAGHIWGNPALPASAYEAAPGEYPWMAQISIPTDANGYDQGGTNFSHVCGGSLIAPDWVLTAGHCLYGSVTDPITETTSPFVEVAASDFRVTLGEHVRSVSPEAGAPAEQVRQVVAIHKGDFTAAPPSQGGYFNDIALLKLSSPVQLNDRVKLVRLASGNDGPGTPAWISGWGWLDSSAPASSNVLREAYTPVRAGCTEWFQGQPDFSTNYRALNTNELCAEQVNPGDPTTPPLYAATCFGDSGGPLVTTRAPGCHEQVGIVSWGHVSCWAVTVYTKVSSHLGWIRQRVPSINGGATYEAENMVHVGGNTHPDGWNIYDNNSYTSFTHAFGGGTRQLLVRAAGQFANGAWPNLQVRVNGVTVFNTTVSSAAWTDYTFSFNAPTGNADVRVYFTNDYYNANVQPPIDRNLFLDRVTVLGSDSCSPATAPLTDAFIPGNDWGSGYCMTISVTNPAATATTNWSATFNVGDGTIYTSWNGSFSSNTGTITVSPTIPSSRTIAPSATDQTVGFCVNRGPSGFKPTNANLSATGVY